MMASFGPNCSRKSKYGSKDDVISAIFRIFADSLREYDMTKSDFETCLLKHAKAIEEIRQAAWDLHRSVGQTYGRSLPYGHHLDMVMNNIRRFGHLVTTEERDVLPLVFGGYYHDSIEDARQSYNDVMATARRWLSADQALTATEIVYALTNDKGRTRAERAGEKYYKGIRETPYAPFVKLCDRLANIAYSCSEDGGTENRMKAVYKGEMGHFLPAINPHSDDCRLAVPTAMIEVLAEILIDDLEREEIRQQWCGL